MASCSDMPAFQMSQLLWFWLTWVTGCAVVLSVIPRGKISLCFFKQKCIFVTVYCLFWLVLSWIAMILMGVCHISHGESRKYHGCRKLEWYTKLLHHKDIYPFTSCIKACRLNQIYMCKLDISLSSFQWSPLHCQYFQVTQRCFWITTIKSIACVAVHLREVEVCSILLHHRKPFVCMIFCINLTPD